MSKATDSVYLGFIRLNFADKSDVVNRINDYFKKNAAEKQRLEEGVALGPLNQSGCPCCGK